MDYTYMKPITMPRGSHYGSDYWIAYSSKLNRQVHLYSMLEYAYFLILEMDHSVEYFCEQPFKISWEVEGTLVSSIFDFWVYFSDGTTEFQEIKYSTELEGNDESAQRSQIQIKRQQKWCDDNNQKYKVVTDKDTYRGSFYINNLKILQHKVSRYNCLDKKIYLDLLEKVLLKNSECSINMLINSNILPPNREVDFLALLYQKGLIDMNIKDRPLDYSTEVQLCENENLTF